MDPIANSSIDDFSHVDVGVLAELLEAHFRSKGATDAQIEALYPAAELVAVETEYQQVQADFSAPVRDGFPRVDTSLRWADARRWRL